MVGAVGELHLEQCLKDLRLRYAKVELQVSEPLVGLREGLVRDDESASADAAARRRPQTQMTPWCDEEGLAVVLHADRSLAAKLERQAASGSLQPCAVTVRALALPRALARALMTSSSSSANSGTMPSEVLAECLKNDDEAASAVADRPDLAHLARRALAPTSNHSIDLQFRWRLRLVEKVSGEDDGECFEKLRTVLECVGTLRSPNRTRNVP